jgi:hypothetical protein
MCDGRSRYPLLIGVVPCVFIATFAGYGAGSVATAQLLLGPLKFTQEEMVIPQIVTMLAGIPANTLGAVRLCCCCCHPAAIPPRQ